MLISVGIHAAAVLAWRGDAGPLPFSVAAGPRAFDPVATVSGGALRAIQIAPPRAIQVPPPPSTSPALDAPELIEFMPQDSRVTGARLASLSPVGRTEPGEGRGDGGWDGEGKFRRTLPVPRVFTPEWNPPREVRGTEVPIRVLVGEDGSTLRVELPAPTSNPGFNRKLLETYGAMDWIPATRGGHPVREWTQITLSF